MKLKKVIFFYQKIIKYFGYNILVSDNIEIRNIYSLSDRPESKIVEKYLKLGDKSILNLENINESNVKNFLLDLKRLGINYIFLMKEADYKNYEKIFEVGLRKNFLQVKIENNNIVLYVILL